MRNGDILAMCVSGSKSSLLVFHGCCSSEEEGCRVVPFYGVSHCREGRGMTAVYRFVKIIISSTLSFNYRNIFHVISRRFGNSEILGSLPELLTHWVTP